MQRPVSLARLRRLTLQYFFRINRIRREIVFIPSRTSRADGNKETENSLGVPTDVDAIRRILFR